MGRSLRTWATFECVCVCVGNGGLANLITGAMDMMKERTAQALLLEVTGTTSTVMTSSVSSARGR